MPEDRMRVGVSERRVRTAPRYKLTVRRFLDWAAEEQWVVEDQEDADYVGFLYGEYIIMTGQPKSWLLPLKSALQYFDPPSKFQHWPWLTEAGKTMQAERPVESHAPVLFEFVRLAVGGLL